MTYTAYYLHDQNKGGILQPVLADTDAAAIELARLSCPETHRFVKLEREDGRSMWDVYLEQFSVPRLRVKAQFYDMEWQRLSDRYFYETAMGKESDPAIKAEADRCKRMAESVLRHIADREAATPGGQGED